MMTDIPDPIVVGTYNGQTVARHGTDENHYYSAGTWTFDLDEDGPAEAEAAIESWTAWREFLLERAANGEQD